MISVITLLTIALIIRNGIRTVPKSIGINISVPTTFLPLSVTLLIKLHAAERTTKVKLFQ